jgi:hypothetical protein
MGLDLRWRRDFRHDGRAVLPTVVALVDGKDAANGLPQYAKLDPADRARELRRHMARLRRLKPWGWLRALTPSIQSAMAPCPP